MRVILSTGAPGALGGPTKYSSALAERLGGWGIESITVSYGRLERMLPTGIRHFVYFLRVFAALPRANAVLAFDTWSVGMPAFCAAKLFRKPFLVRVGGDFLWEHYIERTGDLVPLSSFYVERKNRFNSKELFIYLGTKFLLKHSNVVAFNSRWHMAIWREAYEQPLLNAVFIENVYPTRKEGTHTCRNFVAAGRNIQIKQTKLLEEIFSEIKKEYPDILLDTSVLSPEEHQRRIESCYAVVLASISDIAPNSVIDSVVYNKPFICTADTGLKERLGGVGIFINTRDKEALKGAIISLLNPVFYNEISSHIKAFTFVRTWDDLVKEFAAAIKTCVS